MSETIWTQEDLDTLKAAVRSGVLTVSYNGPPARTVTYQSLDAMRSLLAEMRREVSGSTTRGYRLGRVRKGF